MGWSNPQVRDLVIRTLIGEGAHGDPESWASVANVLKNRASTGSYGEPSVNGLTNAITAKNSAGRHQFSMWDQGASSGGKTISPDNPLYQQAGIIADQVFGGQRGDNTGGADHYYAPGAMTVPGSTPDWAVGKTPIATIGGQHFFKLGLGAGDAILQQPNQTAPVTSSASASVPSDADAQNARTFLSTISQHSDRAGDTANLNPQFAVVLANSIKQARAQGLNVSVMSAFREPGQTGSAYDAGGNSSHTYGLASDIAGLDGPNGKITQQWAQIAAQNGLHNPYGVGNTAEFNHWQLPAQPLEQTPELLAALKTAKATGDISKVWSAYSDASPQSQIATRQTYPPVASAGVNSNAPAVNAQPASATAPGSSGGNFAVPPAGASAGFVGPGSDKVSLVQSMTTGTSHNPQITTAANWGNLFGGGGSPSSPPAAAPAAVSAPSSRPASAPALPVAPPGSPLTPVQPDLSKDAPIGASGPTMPFLPNPFDNPAFSASAAAPAAAPVAPGPITPPTLSPADFSQPLPASVRPAVGATATYSDDSDTPAQMPGGGGRRPAYTPGQPSLGFPAQTNPFGDQTSMNLPGSMLSSAQSLLKLLFPPTNVG